jgi:hypothetical protein
VWDRGRIAEVRLAKRDTPHVCARTEVAMALDAPDVSTLLGLARAELARLPTAVESIAGGLDAVEARERPAPGEWSPVEILCHLRDEETEDFGARLAVIVEGGADFAPIDPEGWARTRGYRETALADAVRAWRERRRATLDRLAALEPAALAGARPHRQLGRLSGLDLLAAWVAHDRLHVAQLASTVARLWAERWSTLRVEYAGDIPYPRSG